jgi:hypothetical protein
MMSYLGTFYSTPNWRAGQYLWLQEDLEQPSCNAFIQLAGSKEQDLRFGLLEVVSTDVPSFVPAARVWCAPC